MHRPAPFVLIALLIAGVFTALAPRPGQAQEATPCPTTSEEENETVARRLWEEAINEGRADLVAALVAPDVLHHRAMGGDVAGIEALQVLIAADEVAHPDQQSTVEDVLSEGHLVAVRVVTRGTQTGTFEGIAASNRPFVLDRMAILRLECGRIAELWLAADALGLLEQFGAVPAMAPPAAATPAAAAFRTAFPDLRFTIEQTVADGDRVAVYWTIQGTHQGMFRGIDPTGSAASWTGMNILQFDCGRIAESWNVTNALSLLQQLGALPELGAPAATPAA